MNTKYAWITKLRTKQLRQMLGLVPYNGSLFGDRAERRVAFATLARRNK